MTRMKTRMGAAGIMAMLLGCPAGTAHAQQVAAPAGYAPLTAPCTSQADGRCAAVSGAGSRFIASPTICPDPPRLRATL